MAVTKEFSDLLLKRSHYLYSFENGAVKDMLVPMRTALAETKDRLDSLIKYSTGYTLDWRIARLSDQIKEIEGILQAASYDSAGILQNKLYEVAGAESNFIGNMLADKFATIGVDIVQLPYFHIDYVINNPLLAVDLQSKLSKASTSSLNSIKSQLSQSIIQGEDIAKATNRLIGPVTTAFTDPSYAPKLVKGTLTKMIADRAEMIARSEILYVSNQISREIFKQNKDVLKGVEYLSALDRRTCIVCASDSGKQYFYKEGSEDHGGPILPRHPSCRCVYAPISYSWAELEKQDKVDKGVSLQTKGAFINVVPKALNYEQWLKTLEPDEVKDILGSTRYKLWDSGELKFSQMAKNNKILSVDELNSVALKTPKQVPLYARADALSDAELSKMSERQIKAWEAYRADNSKARTFGELKEIDTATGIGAEHIVGRKPFDMFIDNDFIEHKVLFGKAQVEMDKDQIAKKLSYLKTYVKNGRAHTVAYDARPGSPTYGTYRYRKGLKNFTWNSMMEVKDFDHLRSIILKGRTKEEVYKQAIVSVPKSNNIKMAEEWAKGKYAVKVVDYDGASPEVGDLINKYLGGSIEKLGVKPKGIFIDGSVFAGKSENAWAMAYPDGSIYFNPIKFASTNQIKADLELLFKENRFATASEGHIVRHEASHLKYFHAGGTEKLAAQKLTSTMQSDLINGIGLENIPKYVSLYARKTQGEFYAEMTAKLLNGEKLHPVCTKIMKDIEKGLKVNGKVKIIENSKGLMAKVPGRIVVKTPEEAKKILWDEFLFNNKNKENIKDAIGEYTVSKYSVWNSLFRENVNLSFNDILKKIEFEKGSLLPLKDINRIKAIQSFLNEAPAYEGVVYRGISFVDNLKFKNHVMKYQQGDIISSNKFLSTSADKDLINKFLLIGDNNIVFEIKSKKGVYLNGLSRIEDEEEVLFKYGSKFKITKVEDLVGIRKGKKVYLEEI